MDVRLIFVYKDRPDNSFFTEHCRKKKATRDSFLAFNLGLSKQHCLINFSTVFLGFLHKVFMSVLIFCAVLHTVFLLVLFTLTLFLPFFPYKQGPIMLVCIQAPGEDDLIHMA